MAAATTAAPTDQQALAAAAAAAAASAGATPVETGLVVLTREEGKNDKLRARLEEMQVRGMGGSMDGDWEGGI